MRPTTQAGVSAPVLPAEHATPVGVYSRLLSRVGLDPALVRFALAILVVSRLAFATITVLALRLMHTIPYGAPVPSLLGAWSRWDEAHYAWLAVNGYQTGPNEIDAAFFPLHPLLTHLVMPLVGGNTDVAGMVVSNVCFVVMLLGLGALAQHDFDAGTARRAMLYLTVFPTALFFFAGYAESLYLALAVWCLYALRRGWWWQAGVLGLLAALTRQMGLFLVLPFALTYAQKAGWRLRGVRPSALWGLLIPAGLLLFMGWLWLTLGDPLAFAHVEVHWTHTLTAPWTTLWRAMVALVHNHDPIGVRKGLVDLGAVVLIGVLIVRGIGRQPAGDLLYSAAVWLLAVAYPTTVWWLQSDARYMMLAFPCFLLLAHEGRRPWLNALILVVFGGALIVMTQYFVRGAVIV